MNEFAPQDRIVTVFGGSGFVGRHLVRALARDGWRVRVATRRPDLAFHLQPLGRVGQINAVQANVRYPELAGRRAARRRRGGQSGRHSRPLGQAELSTPSSPRAPAAVAKAVAAAGIGQFRPSVGDRRRRAVEFGLRPHQGRGRGRGAVRLAVGDDPASLGRVRPRGPVLQSFRRHGAAHAGPAADRRRQDEIAAGLCRRRRRGRRPPAARGGPARRDLRTRRAGRPHHEGIAGVCAGDDPAPRACWRRCPSPSPRRSAP